MESVIDVQRFHRNGRKIEKEKTREKKGKEETKALNNDAFVFISL